MSSKHTFWTHVAVRQRDGSDKVVKVTITVDHDYIINVLAPRAAGSRSGRAVVGHRMVVAKAERGGRGAA